MEKEMPLSRIIIYILRKWIILLIACVLGAISGLIYWVGFQTTDYRIYESTITFDLSKFTNMYAESVASGENWGEVHYSIIQWSAEDALSVITVDAIKTTVYDQNESVLYPNTNLLKDAKRSQFFSSISTKRNANNYSLTVMFAYDVLEENDIIVAEKVVEDYIKIAMEAVKQHYIGTPYEGKMANNVVVDSGVAENRNNTTIESIFGISSNLKPSLLRTLIMLAVIGIVLGLCIIIVVYFADKSIKSIVYRLDENNDNLIGAVKRLDIKPDILYTNIDIAIHKNNIRNFTFLVSGDSDGIKKFVDGYANHAMLIGKSVVMTDFNATEDFLAEDGVSVKAVSKNDYYRKDVSFDCDLEISVLPLNEDGSSIYLAGLKKNALFIVDHTVVKNKDFDGMINQINKIEAKNLGTLLYNKTDSYID